ncbi:HdeD family acid-resistance protein [Cellulomonas massiliensis]|uniref:HdeD family acid-resistance protein n=1 Tax=Cellulomonas massiliensis TaxID=1465811 RepID=UPI0002E6CF99|nr:HdeD family acid-resistance protein [Cellulomonas massiliensis]
MSELAAERLSAELRRIWWVPVVRGAVILLLGLFMLARPLESVTALVWVFGAFAVLDGVLVVVQAFADRRQGAFWWELLGGLVEIALGLVLVLWPQPTATVLFYFAAFWVVAVGVFAVVASIVLYRAEEVAWYWVLAFGLVNLLFGIVLLANPQTSVTVIVVLIGLFACVGGVLLVVSGLATRSMAKALVRPDPLR